jgi:hypothetical protein
MRSSSTLLGSCLVQEVIQRVTDEANAYLPGGCTLIFLIAVIIATVFGFGGIASDAV